MSAGPLPPDCPQLQLATDEPRTASPKFDYRAYELPFPTRLFEQRHGLAHEAPAFDLIWLAAWCGVLYRHTQQDLFRFDCVNRATEAGGEVYGACAVAIDESTTARQLADALDTTLYADTRVVPGVAAIGASFLACAPSADPSQCVEAACADMPRGRDVHLLCVRRGSLTQAHIVYNAALFRGEAVERLAHHLGVLLKGMLADLDRPLAQLPLLTEAELAQLKSDWCGPAASLPTPLLHRYIEAHAVRAPDAVAVVFRDQSWSYDTLNRRANQIAHYLRSQGVGAGVKVAVHLAGSPEALACAIGTYKAGGTYVPLDPTYPVQRLGVILEDTAPRVLFTQEPLPAEIAALAPATFVLGDPQLTLDRQPVDNLDVDAAPDDPAFIIYTSGTTGKPKGVVMSYANLVHYLLVARDRYGYDAKDVIPAFARFTFSITMFEVLSPLIAGARLLILEREMILDFARLTETLRQVSCMHASPSLLRRWLAYMQEHQIDPASFTRLRHVSSGGDVVSADLVENLKQGFPQAEVFVIYGSSEIACMGCTYLAPRDRTVSRNYVGKPFPNVAVRLFDRLGNPVPVGVPGEICFGGGGVALGYLNAPETTREKFTDIDGERFYRMGDLGRFDADGNLEFLGRNDFQIKLRGMRIELLEIDTTLRRIPGVREAIVAEKPFATGEKGLVAYLVLEQDHPPSTVEIRRILQSKLPDYMVPSAFVTLNALPVNFNNKLDRKALPVPSADDFRNLGDYVAPANDTQRRLSVIWQDLLKLDRIGIRDNFFDAGGNSLLSIDLVVRIEKDLHKTLPLSVVLTEPTIERLAHVLDSNASANTGLVLLRSGGPLPPVFLVHDGDGEILPYRKLAYALPPSRPVYGITPLSSGDCPMLHSRIDDVVSHYLQQIVALQPQGPYTVGGLCIGGFIAYEIARRLRAAGQEVDLVALIDAAHVNAPLKSVNAQRVARFVGAFNDNEHARTSALAGARKAGRKLVSFARYVARNRFERALNQSRIRLFRFCLDRQWPIPAPLHRIPVSTLLRFAEKEYVLPSPYDGNVVLMRATRKDPLFDGTPVDDTPYIDLFAEPLMGWEKQLPNLKVYDCRGGHSSMLQDPNVADVALAIMSHLDI